MAPALLIRTSMRGYRARISAARPRTAACDARSASNVVMFAVLLAAALISVAAIVLRAALRATMATLAPRAARALAAARPMPLVAPVIRICFWLMTRDGFLGWLR